jgi:FkbM family methyltransferase
MINIQNKTHDVITTPEYGNQFDVSNEHLALLRSNINKKGKIIDIGANLGLMAILLSENIENTGVICIEPSLETTNILRKNVPNAEVYNCAMSNFNGIGYIQSHGGHQSYRLNKNTGSEKVETRTLDSFNFKDVSLIKIDVEGSEYDVIEGAQDTIKNERPIILCEHHRDLCSVDKLFSIINKINYNIIYLDPENSHPVKTYILVPKNL